MYVMGIPSAGRYQEMALGPPKVALQKVVCFHMGAE